MSTPSAAAVAAYLAALEAYFKNISDVRINKYMPLWIASWFYLIIPMIWVICIKKSKPVAARGIYQTVCYSLFLIIRFPTIL